MHGWGGSTDSFSFIGKKLSDYYTVTLVDFYGFGQSPEPEESLTLDNYVFSILELIRYYKMESVSFICHSFGGRVGLKFCYKYGYLVDKLILTDAAGMKPRRGIKYCFSVYFHRLLTRLGIPHTAGSSDYRKLSPVMKKTFVSIVNEHLEQYAEYIKVPTLLIWGNKDRDTPVYMGKRLLRLIKGSRLILFKGCGHFAYLERYPLFIRIAEVFLAGENHEVDHGKHGADSKRHRVITVPDTKSK